MNTEGFTKREIDAVGPANALVSDTVKKTYEHNGKLAVDGGVIYPIVNAKTGAYYVNEEAHKKGVNKIDLYWFVFILDKITAEFYFVDYDDVSKWDCKLMKYTNAFYIKR